MAKMQAKLKTCGVTQQVDPDYFEWSDDELRAVESAKNGDVTDILKTFKWRLECAGIMVSEMYGILHDRDSRTVWDDTSVQEVVEIKPAHIHVIMRFADDTPASLDEISKALGVEPQYIEVTKRGRYGYDNSLSYLTHIKYSDKYQYAPDDVVTVAGRPYTDLYADRYDDWMAGRARVKVNRSKEGADDLEERILSGAVTKAQVILTDRYYDIYARQKRRMDDAFETYALKKAYRTIQAMEAGDFLISVIFVTGKSRSGKSYFSDKLAESIIEARREQTGESWSVCKVASSNPIDDYLGEEILLMDDLRGSSLTASDWLKLMDPERIERSSARYRNKIVAARVIIINSTKEPLEYFYYVKSVGGGDRSEAMDQFFARILRLVKVLYVPDDKKRRYDVSLPVRRDKPKLINRPDAKDDDEPMEMDYEFFKMCDHDNLDEALDHIVEVINDRNDLLSKVRDDSDDDQPDAVAFDSYHNYDNDDERELTPSDYY